MSTGEPGGKAHPVYTPSPTHKCIPRTACPPTHQLAHTHKHIHAAHTHARAHTHTRTHAHTHTHTRTHTHSLTHSGTWCWGATAGSCRARAPTRQRWPRSGRPCGWRSPAQSRCSTTGWTSRPSCERRWCFVSGLRWRVLASDAEQPCVVMVALGDGCACMHCAGGTEARVPSCLSAPYQCYVQVLNVQWTCDAQPQEFVAHRTGQGR